MKKNLMKRILSMTLATIMSLSLCVPAFAEYGSTDTNHLCKEDAGSRNNSTNIDTSFDPEVQHETENTEDIAKYDGHLVNPDGSVSSVTIDDIDQIILERNKAILAGDTKRANQCQQRLINSGAKPSTPAELAPFSGGTDLAKQPSQRAFSGVSLDTTTYYVYVQGVRYLVKRTDARPTTESNLFHSASVNNKTISSSVSAGVYELLRAAGMAYLGAAYQDYNSYISAYDALRSAITGFAPSTTVYGITATYSCAALEQVSFYQYQDSHGYWTPFASSSYVQTGFGAVIYSTDYAGGRKTGLNMTVHALENTIYSTSSLNANHTGYDTSGILARYFTTYLFDKKSQVTSVSFFHNANGTKKTIKTFGMVCPTTTADIT